MNEKIKLETPPILAGGLGAASPLFLEDLADKNVEAVRAHIISSYEAEPSEIDRFHVLIAYESVGSWGCDSSSWFLLRDKASGALFENHGSHCSCYGFEGQWEPEPTTIEYLKSDRFSFSTGGYDNNEESNKERAKAWICLNL